MISLKWSNYIKNQLSVSPYWRKHNYVKLKISFLPFWIKKLSSLPFKVLIINEIILFLSDYFSFFFELFSIPVGIAELPVQFSTHFRLNKCEDLSTNGNLSFGLFCMIQFEDKGDREEPKQMSEYSCLLCVSVCPGGWDEEARGLSVASSQPASSCDNISG